MMFQENLVGSVIGSIIATLLSIMTWVIIEFLKKYRDKWKIKKNIRLLYQQFAKRKIEPFMGIKIANLIDEIGRKNILNILKFTLDTQGSTGRMLLSKDFTISIRFGRGRNDIDITYDNQTANFNTPDKNQRCIDKFLEFYREQCKIEKIKLKTESD